MSTDMRTLNVVADCLREARAERDEARREVERLEARLALTAHVAEGAVSTGAEKGTCADCAGQVGDMARRGEEDVQALRDVRDKAWERQRELEEENESLKRQLAMADVVEDEHESQADTMERTMQEAVARAQKAEADARHWRDRAAALQADRNRHQAGKAQAVAHLKALLDFARLQGVGREPFFLDAAGWLAREWPEDGIDVERREGE